MVAFGQTRESFKLYHERAEYWRGEPDANLDISFNFEDAIEAIDDEPGAHRRLSSDLDLDVHGVAFGPGPQDRSGRLVAYHNKRAADLGLPATLTVDDWNTVLAMFGNYCAYCRGNGPLVLEHVVPLRLGGGTVAENVLPACRSCNSAKGGRDPLEWLGERFWWLVWFALQGEARIS